MAPFGNQESGEKLPTVLAFQLENNLRSVLEEIMTPIVVINKENNTRLGALESVTKDIESMQYRINQKLESNTKLRDVIDDARAATEKIPVESHHDMDELRR